jgi:hypothetical protein
MGAGLLLSGSIAIGQEIKVDAVRIETSGQFEIDFSAPTNMGSEAFVIEGGTDLNGDWTILGDTSLSGIGAGDWRAATDPSETLAPQRFFRVREGGAELGVTPSALEGDDLVVDLTKAYRGLLDYSIEFLDGSGRAPLSGQVFVNGTRFTLSLPDLSDGVAGEARNLSLILSGAEGTFGRFRLGDGRVRTVLVGDDDSEWAGLLTPAGDRTELGFQVFIRDESEAFLRTNISPLFPPNPASESGGDWTAQDGTFTFSENSFAATFGPIAVGGNSDLALALDTELTLVLSASGTDVGETSISGSFVLTTTAPAAPHLEFEPRSGTFTLLRMPSVPSDAGL